MNKKLAYTSSIIILLVILIVILATMHRSPAVQPAQQYGTTPLQVSKTDVPTSTLPSEFPSSVPLEAGAQITQNYNATADNGIFQATRVFVTKKTLDENFQIYQKYLSQNGWTVVSTTNDPTFKVLSAANGKQNLQITMSGNSVTNQNTVDISYSKLP